MAVPRLRRLRKSSEILRQMKASSSSSSLSSSSSSSSRRLLSLLLVVFICFSALVVADDNASTSAEPDLPDWASTNFLQMTLSTKGGRDPLPQQYTIIPLTQNLGLNESESTRGIIHIEGNLIAANERNFNQITGADDVAYLSCDVPSDDSFIDPDKMLNDLMAIQPKAIVLYSTSRNWCALHTGDTSLEYTSILSMADAGESSGALSYLNGTGSGAIVKVDISGNSTHEDDSDDTGSSSGNKSGVAMSILYTITALITLLFLVIIFTGAVRARRYPERYGPRMALDGQPRQSRAKGIARAVLETLPIVKFGNQEPPKPGPGTELEATTSANAHRAAQPTASRSLDNPRNHTSSPANVTTQIAPSPVLDTPAQEGPAAVSEGQPGCSICTEDFTVGEDVRVLPCGHQYHPTCVDPWLMNVSGTCPLCRLDLRPGRRRSRRVNNPAANNASSTGLPPPLVLDADGVPYNMPRNFLSRFFDINLLRDLSIEESIEALRELRVANRDAEAAAPAGGAPTDGADRTQSTRFADRLREGFRIRTRAQPSQQ